MKELNLLYCFDSGYNVQTFISINSFIKNLKEYKFNIFIIHQNPASFNEYSNVIRGKDQVNSLKIYEFHRNISNYPNLKGKHVSEATYYRLFISDYLPSNIDKLIYVDSDVLCIDDCSTTISNIFNEIIDNNHTIAASTDIIKKNKDHDLFLNLNLNQDKYFNAGVMFIDYKKWLNETSVNEFINNVELMAEKIIFWDQDILNLKFDGKYYELPPSLNFRKSSITKLETIISHNFFIHFVGNHKPWTIEGGVEHYSQIYFDYYKEFTGKKYHFGLKSTRVNSLKVLFQNIINGKIFKTRYPLSFIIEGLKIILK